ncbi:MAG: diguanylate cyclase [Candidatus Sericytochromatia bacterium]|nr:diguanylate cyclase [Candidatus Sericytochromatia bacterium]
MTTEVIASRYKLLRKLGEGGMGVVNLVEDTTTSQQVALKVLSSRLGASEETILQFKQEFRQMAALRHPNCCAVHDFGQLPDGTPFLTMEVVPGHGLDELLPVGEDTFRAVFSQLLLALGYLHRLGFVHCDIKDENARVRPDGEVRLMDFGLMERAGRSSGAIKGTLGYMSPEMARGARIDQRSDLYAMGCLGYQMLTGRLPFPGDNPVAIIKAHTTEAPEPPTAHAPDLDPRLERIILKLLQKDPTARYQSAHDVLEDLGVEVAEGAGGVLLSAPFVGRERELQQLAVRLEALKQGRSGGALLVSAPAGAGKTRLAEEFRFAVQMENLPYVVGAAYEQGTAPYGPFVEALRALLPSLRLHVPGLLERHAPILVKLLPELAVAAAPDLDPPSKEKLRLQATVSEVVAGLAQQRGTVLVLEDWQWADALSGELLAYMLRNTREQPLAFVLNHRGAVEGEPAWRPLVDELSLAPLEGEAIARMVTAILGVEAVGDTFLDQIASFSEGNPFFIEGLLEHLVRNQTLVKQEGRWNTELTLTPEQMPGNLQGLLLEKLAALSGEATSLARIGAVLGRELGLDLLLRVSGLAEEALFDALAELSEQAIFTRTEEGAYRFTQGQLQEVLYANLEPDVKVHLHRRVGEALEGELPTVLSEAPLALVTALAHHVMHADEPQKTVTYALEAGLRSASLFANQDAHRFLTAGLAVLTSEEAAGPLPTPRRKTKLEYLRTLGDVCRVSGRSDEARSAFDEAIPLAEALGESFHLGRMLTSAAKVAQMANDYPTALALTDRSLEVCLAGGDAAGAARCLLTSCRVNYFTGKLSEAVEQTARALTLSREANVPTYIGEALGFIGLMYVSGDPNKLAEGESNLKESVAILGELGDRIGLNNAYNLLGNAQNMQGSFRDAWETFQLNHKICVEIGLKDEEIFALLNLAITAFELGTYEDAIRLAREANAIATALNSKFPLGMAYTLEAAATAFRGELTKGLDGLLQALALSREIQNKYLEALVLLYLLEVQLFLGRLEDARGTGEVLQALIQETGNTEPESRMQALAGEVLIRLGQLPAGRELLEASVAAARNAHARGIQVRAGRALAWATLHEGKLDEAERLAQEAFETAQGIGARHQVALLACLRGEIALQAGRVDLARGHYDTALAEATHMANPLLRALALHGQASAEPRGRAGKQKLTEAQKLLRALVAELDEEPRGWFVALPERARVLSGEPMDAAGAVLVAAAPGGPLGDRLSVLGREMLDLAARVNATQSDMADLEDDHARLERVLEFSVSLADVRNLDQALKRALEGLMRELEAHRGFILLDAEQLRGQVLRGIRPDGGYQADWAIATKLTGEARETGAGVLVQDAQDDDRTSQAVRVDKLALQTAIAVPLKLSGQVVGELYLDREGADGRLYDERDLLHACRLSDQAVLAARNAAAAAEMAQRSRQLEMLNELAEKINETLVVDEVLNLVVQLTLEVTRAERGFLMLRDEGAGDVLVCRAAFDRTGQALLDERISMSICTKVLTTGQAITVVDATTDEEFQTAKSIMSLNLRTLMCVPLQAKGKALGVLYVDSQAVVTTFTEKDLELLRAIAGHSSGAIENATLYTSLNHRAAELERALEMYRQAEHEATTDMLTGLHNRRFFQDQSAREIELSKRHHRNLSVIMLDVDHFKKFNDTYGHAVGDEVLKVVGRVLPQILRASDIPCRFGGEEFVVLCPDTDAPGAARVADRIREAISKVELLDLEGKPVRQITASLGVSSLLPTDERVAEVLERADTALYACKAGGRNQVQIWREGMLSPEELKRKEAQAQAEAERAETKARAARQAP